MPIGCHACQKKTKKKAGTVLDVCLVAVVLRLFADTERSYSMDGRQSNAAPRGRGGSPQGAQGELRFDHSVTFCYYGCSIKSQQKVRAKQHGARFTVCSAVRRTGGARDPGRM